MNRADAELARAFEDAGPDIREALRAVYALGRADAGQREPSPLARRRWMRVLDAAARLHGVTVEDMLARGRRQWTAPVRALHDAMWLLRYHAGLSWPAVGNVVGRDHTSVMAAVKRIDAAIAARPELRDELLAAVEGGRADVRVAAVGR